MLGLQAGWSNKVDLTSVFLPGEFHGHRSLADHNPWGLRESNRTEWLNTFTFTLELLLRKPDLAEGIMLHWEYHGIWSQADTLLRRTDSIAHHQISHWTSDLFFKMEIMSSISYYQRSKNKKKRQSITIGKCLAETLPLSVGEWHGPSSCYFFFPSEHVICFIFIYSSWFYMKYKSYDYLRKCFNGSINSSTKL